MTKPFFSKYQSNFRKGFRAQQNFLSMLEKWKLVADNEKKKKIGTLDTDLSKTFECLSQDFLIANLNPCRFRIDSLIVVKSQIKKNQVYLTVLWSVKIFHNVKEELVQHFCICLIGFNNFFPFQQCYFFIRNILLDNNGFTTFQSFILSQTFISFKSLL